MKTTGRMFQIFIFILLLGACKKDNDNTDPSTEDPGGELLLVANSKKQWTGVAVSQHNRIFANYPNWSPAHTTSVVEITDTANVKAYPDQSWNTWDSTMNPADHFICVQSVFVDAQNFLWILDPANPQRNGNHLGVVNGGAKLLKVDLSSNQVVQKIIFTQPVIEHNSYLNDVRIDEIQNTAYITDSNEGALVVVDLSSGKARRVLSDDPSTQAENRKIVVEGEVWKKPDGTIPSVASDGIALSPDKAYLYWRPLTGESLYRVETKLLRDSTANALLQAKVERLGSLSPSDGMIFGSDGNLYFTSIEENAVRRYISGSNSVIVAQHADLKWPDSFSRSPDGYLYVSTSQIHIQNPSQPYRIFKFKPAL